MKELKEKLQKAIYNIDFDNMCENQKSTLEKALVMLRSEWTGNECDNITINGYIPLYPQWNWSDCELTIIEPKKTVHLDFSDAEKLIGKAVRSKKNDVVYQIISVYKDVVAIEEGTLFFKELSDMFTFLDGRPITKEV